MAPPGACGAGENLSHPLSVIYFANRALPHLPVLGIIWLG